MRVKRKCNHFKCNQGFSSKAACHKKEKTCLSSWNYKTAVMLVLSESFHVFESRIACRCNRFPSRRWREMHGLSWNSSQGCIRPGTCVFHDQYTLTNEVLHITLCVDIISFLLKFSFEFIWIFQKINNKRFQDFSLK